MRSIALLLVRPDARCGPLRRASWVRSPCACTIPCRTCCSPLPWLIWIATRPGGIRLLGLLCAGYLPLCLLLGVGWFEFTNHLRSAGRELQAAPAGATDRCKSMLSVFSLPTATVLLARSIGVAKVWVWAVPGVLILAATVRSAGVVTRCACCSPPRPLTTLIGYFFFPPDQGHGWGYRYFHSAWMALPLLATAAIFRPAGMRPLARGPAAGAAGCSKTRERKSYVTACVLLTLVFGVGLRAWQMQDFMAYDLNQLPHYPGTERHVVIMDPNLTFYGGGSGAERSVAARQRDSHDAATAGRGSADDGRRIIPPCTRCIADHHAWVWSARSTLMTTATVAPCNRA